MAKKGSQLPLSALSYFGCFSARHIRANAFGRELALWRTSRSSSAWAACCSAVSEEGAFISPRARAAASRTVALRSPLSICVSGCTARVAFIRPSCTAASAHVVFRTIQQLKLLFDGILTPGCLLYSKRRRRRFNRRRIRGLHDLRAGLDGRRRLHDHRGRNIYRIGSIVIVGIGGIVDTARTLRSTGRRG